MGDRMIRTGDLVVPDDILQGLDVYPHWGSKERGMPKSSGYWKGGEVGVILESLEVQGGNGCKVLCGGVSGWVYLCYLKIVDDEK